MTTRRFSVRRLPEFLVGKQNRTLTIGAIVYNIVNAFVWADLDYVEADVRLVSSNG